MLCCTWQTADWERNRAAIAKNGQIEQRYIFSWSSTADRHRVLMEILNQIILEHFCFQIGTVKFKFGAIIAVCCHVANSWFNAKNRYNVDDYTTVLRNKNANNLTKVFREETKEQRLDKNLLMQQKCSSVSWQKWGNVNSAKRANSATKQRLQRPYVHLYINSKLFTFKTIRLSIVLDLIKYFSAKPFLSVSKCYNCFNSASRPHLTLFLAIQCKCIKLASG